MDSFVIAVLVGAGVVILVLALLIVFDKKGKNSVPPATPTAKSAGKR